MGKRLYTADVNLQADTLLYTYECGREGEYAPSRVTAEQKINIKEIAGLADRVSKALSGCDVSNLRTLGGTLYDRLIPKGFASAITPLQGASELPPQPSRGNFVFYLLNPKIAWIPWELLYDGDAFLCRRFCVSRSLVKTGDEFELAQKRLDALRQPGVMVLLGETSGLNTNKEIEEILRILTPVVGNDRIVVRDAANAKVTVDYLKENYDICHFIGHGVFSTKSRKDSGWRLRDGTVLTCSDIERVKSPKAVFPRLIIANSCYSARSAPSSSNAQQYVTSLYRSFLSMGVPQYIGTIASVPDDVSQVFTSAFYTALASGNPVGEAVFQAREAASAGPGWGYYVHYGDPGAPLFVSRGSQPGPQASSGTSVAEAGADTLSSTGPTWQPPLDERVEESLRTDDMARLRKALQANHILTITGEAKIGKTSLATLLAMKLEAEEGATVLYHDFRLDTTAILLERFLERAGITPRTSFNDNVSSFLGLLSLRRCCVLLDNFEEALGAGHTITDPALSHLIDLLLAGRSRFSSFVVATSRVPIQTRNHNTVPAFPLNGIGREQAVDYLKARYSWSTDQAERIYEVRSGHPWAMHICSIRVQQLQDLGIAFGQALSSSRTTVADLISGNLYDSLTDPEKSVLHIVALHPCGIGFEGLTGMSDSSDVGNAIIELHQKGALSKTAGGWLQTLPEDRLYIYQRISEPEKLHLRAANYCASLLKGKMSQDTETSELAFYHATRAKSATLCYEVLFLSSLAERLRSISRYESLAQFCAELIGCSGFEGLPIGKQARSYLTHATALLYLGKRNEACNALPKATALFKQCHDHLGTAEAYSEVGILMRELGPDDELHFQLRALEELKKVSNDESVRLKSIVLGRKGETLERRGSRPDEVLDCYERSLALALEIKDRDPALYASRFADWASAIRDIKGDFELAELFFAEAIFDAELPDMTVEEMFRYTNPDQLITAFIEGTREPKRPETVSLIAGLANTYEKAKQFMKAKSFYELALAKTNPADVYGMIPRLGTLAHVHYALRDFEKSQALYFQAFDLADSINDTVSYAQILDGLGAVFRERGRGEKSPDRAIEWIEKARVFHEQAVGFQESREGDFKGRAHRYAELGRTLLVLKEAPAAKSYFIRAILSARKANQTHLEAWQFLRLGEAYEAVAEVRDAALCYQKSVVLFGSAKEGLRAGKKLSKLWPKMTQELREQTETGMKDLDRGINELLQEDQQIDHTPP